MKGISTAFEVLMLLSILSIFTLAVILSFQSNVQSIKGVKSYDEAYMVASKVVFEIESLSNLQYAKKRLEIPENIGGKGYFITLSDNSVRIENDIVNVSVKVSGVNIIESSAYSTKAYLIVENGYVRVENE
ncbi:hypothetical protein [Archaeoglobus profundus]|uniref:Flagellin n=1 Tax=Archaeoglobus profundus (strain DSM 5631 / JCM 9629 / NBRC 100127 / Av18) TaxID=572546 RepID=D2RHK6_ARCPA|nr:hypothetical protein [Archaeoglobus profundus]ADB57781.1 hypothetical protein Arcpr_0717 [Archaeoglobus profundus DSM 5631]